MEPWKIPPDYGGQTWYGWYAIISQNRDSGCLERSNYRTVLERLRKYNSELQAENIDSRNAEYDSVGDDTVTDTRQGHWAVGWVEVIFVHSSNAAAVTIAQDILDALEDYPVVDDEDFSNLEYEEMSKYWSHCGMRQRIQECSDAGVSIFAARREYPLPGRLEEHLIANSS